MSKDSFFNTSKGLVIVSIAIFLLVSLFDYFLGIIASSIYLGINKNFNNKSRQLFLILVFAISLVLEFGKSFGHEDPANLIGRTIFGSVINVFVAMFIVWLSTKLKRVKK